jgi:hypothetical protein
MISSLSGIWTRSIGPRRCADSGVIKKAVSTMTDVSKPWMRLFQHYGQHLKLGLSEQERKELLEFMKSL